MKSLFLFFTIFLISIFWNSQSMIGLSKAEVLSQVKSDPKYKDVRETKDENGHCFIVAKNQDDEGFKWHINFANYIYRYDILTDAKNINWYISYCNKNFVKEDEENLWTDWGSGKKLYIKMVARDPSIKAITIAILFITRLYFSAFDYVP